MSVPISILNGMNTSEVSALRTVVIQDKQSFRNLSHEWNEMLERSGVFNIYQSHEWLYSWWCSFGERASSELLIVCIYSEQLLIAIAPFYISKNARAYGISKNSVLCLIGQKEEDADFTGCEQLDVITGKVVATELHYRNWVIKELLHFLRQTSSLTRLVFHKISKKSILYQLVRGLPYWQVKGFEQKSTLLSVPLPENFDTFTAAQSRRWRAHYRGNRKLMALTGQVEIRRTNSPHNIHVGLQSLALIMCTKQRKKTGGVCMFDAEQYMHFHDEVCHQLSVKGEVEILSLILEGRLLASICYFNRKDGIQVYKMASVRGDGIRFSPLLLLLTHVIEQAIQEKKSRIDFLSDCADNSPARKSAETGSAVIQGEKVDLFTVQWFKNPGHACLRKSLRKLYQTLHVKNES